MHESQYPHIPRLLCEWSPDFARSPEAASVAQDFDLVTVVADAFGEYILAEVAPDSEELPKALAAIERMAESDEANIQYCAIEGLLSRLEGTDASRALIPMLGPRSHELYRMHGSTWR